MRQHIIQNFGRYLLCLLLMTVGLGAFAVKSWIDIEFWVSQAATPEGKWQFGGAALVFCCSSLIFACVVASRLRDKVTFLNVVGTAFATAVLIYVTAYGMASIVGFGARERLNPYSVAKAEVMAKKKAVDATNALQKSYVDGQLAYLQEQGRKARGPQSKQAAYTAAGDVFGSLEVKPEPVDVVSADSQATALHGLFPQYTIEQIQRGWVAAFGIGLLIIELFGMGFGVGMWPRYVPRATEDVIKWEPKEEGAVIAPALPSAEIIHPPQFAPKPAQALIEEPVEATQSELFRDVDEHMTALEQVHEFWRTATAPVDGARIAATPFYRAYLNWCKVNEQPACTQVMFGRISGTICERDKTTSGYYYLGRAILQINEDGESEVLRAA